MAALLATGLLLGGGLIVLLGLVALAHVLTGGDTPRSFALGLLVLGGACAMSGWLLGRGVRRR